MKAYFLARRQGAANWELTSPSTEKIGKENEYRIRSEGGEAYNLSEEAVRAFFALSTAARALVKTSILGQLQIIADAQRQLFASTTVLFFSGIYFFGMAAYLLHLGLPRWIPGLIMFNGILCLFVCRNAAVHSDRLSNALNKAMTSEPYLKSIITADHE